MKRGIRRLIVVVGALVGLGVAYWWNAEWVAGLRSCFDMAYATAELARCNEVPDSAACRREAERERDRIIESCKRDYGGWQTRLGVPVVFGGLAFLGVALFLEFIRLIVAWVIAGFRQ